MAVLTVGQSRRRCKAAPLRRRWIRTEVGQRVLRAIKDNEFYVFTHTAERDAVRARHDRISAGFDRAEEINRDGSWNGSLTLSN